MGGPFLLLHTGCEALSPPRSDLPYDDPEYGKFGHADLAGTMFQFTNAIGGTNIRNLNSGSWQGHAIKSSGDFSNVNIDRTYWAFGARCVRPAAN